MTTRLQHPLLQGPAGVLEGALHERDGRPHGIAALVLHPHPMYGGTLDNKVVHRAASTLHELGAEVLRINFRGVGKSEGTFDDGDGELEDARGALGWLRQRYPGARVWLAGFSFGSWIALETGAADPRVSVLIGIAPPVTRENYSFARTLETTKPKFFVQGDMDELCPLKDLMSFYAKLKEPKEIAVVHGAKHLFDGQTVEVGEALEDLLADYE